MSYRMKRILVTGGAGFIGSNFIRRLLNEDIFIVNLDLLTYAGSKDNLIDMPAKHHFIQGDISDRTLVDSLLQKYNIDTIVHFAAESHVDRSIDSPSDFIKTNIVGTFTLLEAAKNYWLNEKHFDETQCRFHHISTDEVYGSLGKNDPAFTENTAYSPNSPYSASKASSDHLVNAYFHTYHLPITMSNCSNNYGPFQHTEKLLPTIIRSCVQQKPIPIYGDGQNIRDWLFVDDHCDAISNIIKNGQLGETYNIGGEYEINNLDLAKKICCLFDELRPQDSSYQKLITFVEDRAGHDWRYAIDINKIHRELGWKPKTNFDEGLLKTLEFYL